VLPSACRHFPRVIVNDPRGASVTLSHFCPTAAGLLFAGVPLGIVAAPPAVALGGTLEGLDATGVLPPLLSPTVLTDWDGYSAWEERAVALFNVANLEPERAVALLIEATVGIGGWKPGRQPLAAAVHRAFDTVETDGSSVPGRWDGFAGVVNAFLAAHAFASWAAYSGGLRSVAAAVAETLEMLTREVDARGALSRETLTEAVRATDLRVRHGSHPNPPPRQGV
jgi:hypothetical protein